MVTLITLLIAMAAMVAVVAPLTRTRDTGPASGSWERERLDMLLSRRDSAYNALHDLDFEYQIGNLSESDYRELRERYRLRAAALLQRIDRLGMSPQPASEQAAKAAQELSLSTSAGETACPTCSQPGDPGDSFCRHCGARLR